MSRGSSEFQEIGADTQFEPEADVGLEFSELVLVSRQDD